MFIMKKVGILIIVVLLLTACGSNAVDPDIAGSSVDTTLEEKDESSGDTELDKKELTTDYTENSLPVVLQLLVGTLLLEETELAVGPEMAESLLPYWKMYITLTESDTTAEEEMDAVIDQIQDIMSTEQVNYIVGLVLDQEAMVTLMNDLEILESFNSGGSGEVDGTVTNRPEGMPEGSQPGGGGGTGGGDGTGGGANPELMATKQAAREEVGDGMMRSRLTIPLLEALISLLEGKAGS